MPFLVPVIFPAFAISTNASTYISVCTPRSFKSDFAISEPTAFGIPPMPSWRHAPSGISLTIYFATASSTGVAAPPPPSSSIAGLSPSTIMATSLICTPSPKPPRHLGIFWFTSTIIISAILQHASICEALGPKLKKPWLSIGATWNIATRGGVLDS